MALGGWPALGLKSKEFEVQRLEILSLLGHKQPNISPMRTCQQQLRCR